MMYSQDEKAGIVSAMLACTKGFDNIFYLTGGIDEFGCFFPDMVEGSRVPEFTRSSVRCLIRRQDLPPSAKAVQAGEQQQEDLTEVLGAVEGHSATKQDGQVHDQ